MSRSHGVLSCSWAVEGLLLLGLSPAESKCIYDEVATTLIRVTEEGCRFECIAIDTAEDIARKAIRLLTMCLSCLSAAEAAEERDTSSPQESSEMDQVGLPLVVMSSTDPLSRCW